MEWVDQPHEVNLVVKRIYGDIMKRKLSGMGSSYFNKYWKWKIPKKILLFIWLVWKGRVLTWDRLKRIGIKGPSSCPLCEQHDESAAHLFLKCPFTLQVWNFFSIHIKGFIGNLMDIIETIQLWEVINGIYKFTPFYLIWEIWLVCNMKFFEDEPLNLPCIYGAIMRRINGHEVIPPSIRDLSHRLRPHHMALPAVYFDGAARGGVCGCGAWIKMPDGDTVQIHWNGGRGSNNRAELLPLWSGLWMAKELGLLTIHVYGDFKIVIDGISGR